MPKVLLADDDFTMVALLKTLLNMEGFQVETLLDKPGDKLDFIRSYKPDFFLVDIFLGDHNGMDLVREIRSKPEMGSLKIIMVSGLDKREDCLRSGANAFLLKPYMPDELFALLRKCED